MIYATILLCSATFPLCTEDHAYHALRGGQYLSIDDCQRGSLLTMPLVPHEPGDTFRIVCGGRWLDLGKEA